VNCNFDPCVAKVRATYEDLEGHKFDDLRIAIRGLGYLHAEVTGSSLRIGDGWFSIVEVALFDAPTTPRNRVWAAVLANHLGSPFETPPRPRDP
jgi:hypothetical protein